MVFVLFLLLNLWYRKLSKFLWQAGDSLNFQFGRKLRWLDHSWFTCPWDKWGPEKELALPSIRHHCWFVVHLGITPALSSHSNILSVTPCKMQRYCFVPCHKNGSKSWLGEHCMGGTYIPCRLLLLNCWDLQLWILSLQQWHQAKGAEGPVKHVTGTWYDSSMGTGHNQDIKHFVALWKASLYVNEKNDKNHKQAKRVANSENLEMSVCVVLCVSEYLLYVLNYMTSNPIKVSSAFPKLFLIWTELCGQSSWLSSVVAFSSYRFKMYTWKWFTLEPQFTNKFNIYNWYSQFSFSF